MGARIMGMLSMSSSFIGGGHQEEAIYFPNPGARVFPSLVFAGSFSALQSMVTSGGCVHFRDLSGHLCRHCQTLGGHIGSHARCPLGLFLTVGFHTQLLQPFLVVFGSKVGLQVGGINEIPRAGQTPIQAASGQVRVGLGDRVWPGSCGALGPQFAVNLIKVRPPSLRLHLASQGVRSVCTRPAGATHGSCDHLPLARRYRITLGITRADTSGTLVTTRDVRGWIRSHQTTSTDVTRVGHALCAPRRRLTSATRSLGGTEQWACCSALPAWPSLS